MSKLKTKKNNKPINISQVLVVKSPQHTSVDIQNWTNAMNAAHRGKRNRLVSLYDNLLLDGVLFEAMDKRIRAITNAKITFQKDSKEVVEMFDFMDNPAFENLLKEIMLSKFYGKSVIEMDFTDGFKITSIDRRHLDTEKKQILLEISDQEGISYENNDFILNIGEDKDLGLFCRTAPHVIFKRNGGADYSQFCELFGIPQLVGYYDPEDEKGQKEMEEAFKHRGSAGSMTASNKSKIETIGTSINSSTTIHKDFIGHCDEQILITIQGQTMTTTDGTSLAQAKIHAQTMNDIEKADRLFVRRILNYELKPRLEKRGFPVAGGWFNFIEEEENMSALQRLEIAERVDRLTEDGVDDNHFYEEFGLPKGSKSKSRVKEISPQEKQEQDTEEEQKENPPQEENPERKKQKKTAKELSLFQRLMDFFAHAPQ